MAKALWMMALIAMLCCLTAGTAVADRLILIPTGNTLTTGGISAEYAAKADGDGKAYWVNVGISRFELEGARFQDFGLDDADAISAQVAVVPETSFTPAIALGVRDISDETDGIGLYGGQSFYLTATKGIPITGGIPLVFQDVKLHGGIGTGGLSGVFFGVEGTLPMGIRLAAEYDTEDFNAALYYNVIPVLRAEIASIKDDIYYGASFTTSF